MIDEKKAAFDIISRVLAIIKLDIEHHQSINDYSLNIHGEDYFKDVFNFVYNSNFINSNYEKFNEPYIDLIDKSKKKLIQITTTRTKEKILHSLKALSDEKYQGYDISIYYLLGKALPNSETIQKIEVHHPEIKLKDILKDSSDLL